MAFCQKQDFANFVQDLSSRSEILHKILHEILHENLVTELVLGYSHLSSRNKEQFFVPLSHVLTIFGGAPIGFK